MLYHQVQHWHNRDLQHIHWYQNILFLTCLHPISKPCLFCGRLKQLLFIQQRKNLPSGTHGVLRTPSASCSCVKTVGCTGRNSEAWKRQPSLRILLLSLKRFTNAEFAVKSSTELNDFRITWLLTKVSSARCQDVIRFVLVQEIS